MFTASPGIRPCKFVRNLKRFSTHWYEFLCCICHRYCAIKEPMGQYVVLWMSFLLIEVHHQNIGNATDTTRPRREPFCLVALLFASQHRRCWTDDDTPAVNISSEHVVPHSVMTESVTDQTHSLHREKPVNGAPKEVYTLKRLFPPWSPSTCQDRCMHVHVIVPGQRF